MSSLKKIVAHLFGKRNTQIQPVRQSNPIWDWLDYSAGLGYLPPALAEVKW